MDSRCDGSALPEAVQAPGALVVVSGRESLSQGARGGSSGDLPDGFADRNEVKTFDAVVPYESQRDPRSELNMHSALGPDSLRLIPLRDQCRQVIDDLQNQTDLAGLSELPCAQPV